MGRRRGVLLGAAAALCGALAGCSADVFSRSDDGQTPTPAAPGTVPPPADGGSVGYTHVTPSRNRVLAGEGAVDEADPAVYEPDGRPAWLVGVPTADGSSWLVATADGRVDRFTVADGAVTDAEQAGTLPAGTPPVARRVDGRATLAGRPPDVAPFTHPVPVGDGRQLYVATGGDLVLSGDGVERARVDALPDTRLVRVAPERYAFLAGRTERYGHGVLGDAVEAERVVLADARDGLTVETVADPAPVVEEIAPLAGDLTRDGRRELVVTLSDGTSGARLAAFDLSGARVATGPGFSAGNRWRHQLCVAPFGPEGGVELAAVETPHIGGSVRFYRLEGTDLRAVASYGGVPGNVDGPRGLDGTATGDGEAVSTHVIGSRNLDGAVAGDLDGDGDVELLVPTLARDELLALRRTADGVDVAWRLPVGGELVSNIAGVAGTDGPLAVAAAGSDGTVRVRGR
jgi:hypothetical protein